MAGKVVRFLFILVSPFPRFGVLLFPGIGLHFQAKSTKQKIFSSICLTLLRFVQFMG